MPKFRDGEAVQIGVKVGAPANFPIAASPKPFGSGSSSPTGPCIVYFKPS
jgi:hypothetical protein